MRGLPSLPHPGVLGSTCVCREVVLLGRPTGHHEGCVHPECRRLHRPVAAAFLLGRRGRAGRPRCLRSAQQPTWSHPPICPRGHPLSNWLEAKPRAPRNTVTLASWCLGHCALPSGFCW